MESCRLLWLLVSLSTLIAQTIGGFNLTIMHTNDIHGCIQQKKGANGRCSAEDAAEGKCFGGVARLKTKIDEIRTKFPNTLLLDGGDQYQGTLLFYVYQGQIMSHFMNMLGYDAMALGNHEFDNGPGGLVPFLNNVTFPVMSCNIDVSDVPEMNSVVKSTTIVVSNQTIGIVGYTTKDTPFISKAGKVKFHDEISSIQASVNQLLDQGVDKVIALGHAGIGKDKEIAKKVNGIDVVVGGHTNTFLYTGDAPSHETPEGQYPLVIRNDNGQDVLVVQDFAYGKYLGFLQVDFDDQGKPTAWNGNPILMDNTVAQNEAVNCTIQKYLPGVNEKMQDVIGMSLVHLEGERKVCRVRECNLGSLLTDAMVRQNLHYADSLEWSNVSIALMNGGGIRSSIERGELTPSDVLGVLPFRNTIDIVTLSGNTIRQALEHSAALWVDVGDYNGGFLQMSGLRVVYDMRREEGQKVVQVEALCTACPIPEFKPLVDSDRYKVLLTSFLVTGGDGYSVIKDNIIGEEHIIGDTDSSLVLSYISENGPLMHGLDGRIKFMQDIEDSKLCSVVNQAFPIKSSMFFTICISTILSLIFSF